jgi:hypothetical protein
MQISLTPEQEAWLQARFAAHDNAAIEAAARRIIDERIAQERKPAANGREVLLVGELSDADLAEIAATEMDSRYRHLDAEVT